MTVLLSNAYVVVDEIPGPKLVRFKRTSVVPPARQEQAFLRELKSVLQAFAGRGYSALIDLRDAPMRNDPKFEGMAADLRAAVYEVFTRVVIVVRTATGKLQVNRLVTQDGGSVALFDDEQAALSYLLTPPSGGR